MSVVVKFIITGQYMVHHNTLAKSGTPVYQRLASILESIQQCVLRTINPETAYQDALEQYN